MTPISGPNLQVGPKMYNAYGSLEQDKSHGSTRLHLDVTGAVNIMLYAANLPDNSPGSAVWHIFPSSATALLRDFLQEEPSIGYKGPGDPIHDQVIYLSPPLLARLATTYRIHPYTIFQTPGDAVFIPAGCAHQVSVRCHVTVHILISICYRLATRRMPSRLRVTS
jgi:lysine-specific demethylase 3